MDILVNNLCKRFGETVVFDGFSATFEEGKLNTLTGSSGSGKTTLLRILLGLEKADEGTILGVPEGPVGCVFQEDRLLTEQTALKNIQLTAGARISDTEISEHLTAVGLSGNEKTLVSELSGGMKRRVAIVRAVCADTPLVVMDEPFSGLDEQTREKTLAYIRKYTAGKTVILVSHDRVESDKEIKIG